MAVSTAMAAMEHQPWLDPVSETVQPAITRTLAAGGLLGRGLKHCLHGTWLGHPLHPVVTDLPLGAWAPPLSWIVWRSPRDTPRAVRVPRRPSMLG